MTDSLKKKSKLPWKVNRPLVYSALLHAALLVVLSMHWVSADKEVKKVHIPEHVNASVVDVKQIKAIQDKKDRIARQKAQAVEQKKRAERKAREAERKRKKAIQEKRAAERKRKEAERLALKKKKEALEKKRQAEKKAEDEQRKQEAEKQRKQQLAEEQRRQEAQKQAKAQEEREKERQRQEALLQKALEAAEAEKAKAEAKAREEANRRAEQLAADARQEKEDADEITRYMALIEQQVRQRWHRPLSARTGMEVWLSIALLPTGEVDRIELASGSGDPAFDRSALAAAKSLRRYPVPDDNRLFEENFRRIKLKFKPDS